MATFVPFRSNTEPIISRRNSVMKKRIISYTRRLFVMFEVIALQAAIALAQTDDPNVDRAVYAPSYSPQPRGNNQIMVV
ncbi:MAG TPA: hypothetical protein DGH68_06950, partial [Bacteroidetes bacterium]|nr:hypothetical protein [Bacteroidota bacterium]